MNTSQISFSSPLPLEGDIRLLWPNGESVIVSIEKTDTLETLTAKLVKEARTLSKGAAMCDERTLEAYIHAQVANAAKRRLTI